MEKTNIDNDNEKNVLPCVNILIKYMGLYDIELYDDNGILILTIGKDEFKYPIERIMNTYCIYEPSESEEIVRIYMTNESFERVITSIYV